MSNKTNNIFPQPKCIERYNNNAYNLYLSNKCCPCISYDIHYCNCKCHQKNKIIKLRNSSQFSKNNSSYISSQCDTNPYLQKTNLNKNETFCDKKTYEIYSSCSPIKKKETNMPKNVIEDLQYLQKKINNDQTTLLQLLNPNCQKEKITNPYINSYFSKSNKGNSLKEINNIYCCNDNKSFIQNLFEINKTREKNEMNKSVNTNKKHICDLNFNYGYNNLFKNENGSKSVNDFSYIYNNNIDTNPRNKNKKFTYSRSSGLYRVGSSDDYRTNNCCCVIRNCLIDKNIDNSCFNIKDYCCENNSQLPIRTYEYKRSEFNNLNKIDRNYSIEFKNNKKPDFKNNKLYTSNFNFLIKEKNLSNKKSKKKIIKRMKEIITKKIVKKNKSKMSKSNKNNKSNLISKLNIDNNLTIEEKTTKNFYTNLKRNIPISQKTIFTIFTNENRLSILCFDLENKIFSLQDFDDFSDFEKNYFESLNNNTNGNIIITINNNLYIITGKNYDIFYEFVSSKKSMNKLCNLKNNHSNGTIVFHNNKFFCLSGDFNKKIEIYYETKNEWKNLNDCLNERSNSFAIIYNNKYLFNIFGYNYPTKKCLSTIEYMDISELDNNNFTEWKYLEYKNSDKLSLNIKNFFCINYFDQKLIIVGGYNGKIDTYEKQFIQILFGDNNNLDDAFVEVVERKFKDIDKNKKYLFNGQYGYYIGNKNELFYGVFDSDFNCHVFQVSNMGHDVYYICNSNI